MKTISKLQRLGLKLPGRKSINFLGIQARSQPKMFQPTREWKMQWFPMKLRVIGHDDWERHFRVYEFKSLKRLKEKYAEQIQIPVSVIRFLYGGYVINDNDTPYLLEMKDNDLIHALY